ncbi:hypothetical protein HS125_09355 [bacterium]|nr:hypothetical protein [bacterium]
MNRRGEFKLKLARVRTFLTEQELDGVLLCRRPNFSWLSCGARSFVSSVGELANGYFLVTHDRVVFMSNNIERRRWLTEELADLPLEARGVSVARRDAGESWRSFSPRAGGRRMRRSRAAP